MNRILFIALSWLLAGVIALGIDRLRIRKIKESPFPALRCIFLGWIALIIEILLAIWKPTPATPAETKFYDK